LKSLIGKNEDIKNDKVKDKKEEQKKKLASGGV
jgi:hypothetical protein